MQLSISIEGNSQGCEERVQQLRNAYTGYAAMSTEAILDSLHTDDGAILGTPDQVIAQLQLYAAAGVEELMIQWISLDDLEGIAIIAEYILPRFIA